ncbi:MAG: hypothetical protein AAGG11_05860 [Pseudomonadota bacterium]
MQIFFGAPAPFAYPSAPALAASAPTHSTPAPAGAGVGTGSAAGSAFSLFGNPYAFAGPAAAGSGHTVVNSTNALQSGPATGAAASGSPAPAPLPAASFGGGFAGGYLVPAFAAPVMVPGFFVVAVPYAVAAPQGGQPPVPDSAPAPSTGADVEPAPTPVPAAPAPVTAAPVIDVVPAADEAARADAADTPQSRALTRLYDGRSEVSFALSLTTLEGDTVSIDFRQAASAAQGVVIDGDGEEWLQRDPAAEREDSFQLTIEGNLNVEERRAIDALMDEVLALSDAFFRGDDRAVTQGLMTLNLDGQTLSEMALSLTVTQSVEVQRGYGRELDALDQLRRSGGERLATLEYLASAQKQLIDQAREIFDAPSAVRFVRDALGPLLQGAMDSLNDALEGTFAAAETTAADAVLLPSATDREEGQPERGSGQVADARDEARAAS